MSIRLVDDAGNYYWFTSGNWRRVLAFATRHGWSHNPACEPDNWGKTLMPNDKYEIVGRASLSKAECDALAEAIDRGVREDPIGASVAKELQSHAQAVREKLPDYDPARHAAELLKEWSRFREFIRGKGTLRVDLTD